MKFGSEEVNSKEYISFVFFIRGGRVIEHVFRYSFFPVSIEEFKNFVDILCSCRIGVF